MPISVVCDSCQAKLNAPDTAAGKTVKCPKCKNAITVPDAAAPQFEVVDEEPAAPKKAKPAPSAPAKKKPVAVEDEDDEDEKPKKKKPVLIEDDDEDEKPKKKKPVLVDDDDEDEDDDDDRPKKKKKKKKVVSAVDSGNMARTIIGIVVLIIAIGIAVYVFWDRARQEEKNKEGSSENPPAQDAPRSTQNPPNNESSSQANLPRWKPDPDLLASLGTEHDLGGFSLPIPKGYELQPMNKPEKLPSGAVLTTWTWSRKNDPLVKFEASHFSFPAQFPAITTVRMRGALDARMAMLGWVAENRESNVERGVIASREFERVQHTYSKQGESKLNHLIYVSSGHPTLTIDYIGPEADGENNMKVCEASIKSLRKH